MGQFDGDPVWIMYYAYTVYGVWYSQKALDEPRRAVPGDLGRHARPVRKAKKKGIAGWTYAGKYPYYLPFSLYPFIGKIGGREVLDKIDNLEPNAWKDPAVKAAFEAYYELYKKGYILKGTPGLDHIQSQTAWAKGKALFIPNGSWVENESAKVIPADFQLTVGAPTGLDSSDKMPFGTIWASGGEPFIVPAKAKNAEGGMEQLRIMLCEASSKNFTSSVKSLTAFNGGTDGIELTPGLKSGVAALEKAGEQRRQPAAAGLVRASSRRSRSASSGLGEMMAGRLTPAEAIKKVAGLRGRGRQGPVHQALQAPVRARAHASPAAAPAKRSGSVNHATRQVPVHRGVPGAPLGVVRGLRHLAVHPVRSTTRSRTGPA